MKTLLAITAALATVAGAAQAGERVQVAQQCGWFAILGCFSDRGSAENWNSKIEFGRVIDTSSMRYPNFRPGFYCVVAGPTGKGRAGEIARGWRVIVPDAYVKSSC